MGSKTTKRDSIVMFRGQLVALMELTSMKDVKSLVSAVIEYGMNGNQDVEVPDHLRFGWSLMKSQIDSVNSHYEEVRQKRQDAANARYAANGNKNMQKHANACKSMQMDANVTNACNNENVYENENVYVPTINVGDINSAREFRYPDTAAKVINLASQAGCIMESWEAEMYLADRESKGWKANGQDKAMSSISQIRADIKKWCLRRDNDIREREQKQIDRKKEGF